MKQIWTSLWETEVYVIKQLYLRSVSLCISYMISTIRVSKAKYKENKDIFKMLQETEECKSCVMLYRTNWIIANMKL